MAWQRVNKMKKWRNNISTRILYIPRQDTLHTQVCLVQNTLHILYIIYIFTTQYA